MTIDPNSHFITTQDSAAASPFEMGTIQWLRNFGDAERESLAAGYWYVTTADAPEPFPLTAHLDESFHLLSGRIRIDFLNDPHNNTVELTVGDSMSYNAGTKMRWTVLEDASKFFVYSGGAQ